MKYTKCIILALLFLVVQHISFSQQKTRIADSNRVNKSRLRTVIVSGATLYGGSLLMLNNLWYKDYPRSSFHFYDDNDNWLQMDKIGHSYSAYQAAALGHKLFRWAGVNEKKSVWYAGGIAFLYLTNIEILDGFSTEWGASPGDLIANISGAALFISQELAWNEQKIRMKYSFHQTIYPQYNPGLLGKNFGEQIIKDYNGQTYWLSFNVASFTKQNKIPNWLNLAIGYSAKGMIGGSENPLNMEGHVIPRFERTPQIYFAPDIDFEKFKTHSKFVKSLFFLLNTIKIPSPAIEYSKESLSAHWLYF